MRFFLDNCVPDSVGKMLESFGHEVIYQRQALATDAPDPIVAVACIENNAILMTFDKDYKAIASRFAVSHRRYKTLSRVDFTCSEPAAAKRIEAGMSLIQAEWELCQNSKDRRMFIVIGSNSFRTTR